MRLTTSTCTALLGFVLAVTGVATAGARAGSPLVVHEWGTFTSFQDEDGDAFNHINTDDEPVPPFVHELGDALLFQPTEYPPFRSQGAAAGHPDVTMRLETPVLYFHLPAGRTEPLKIDVSVSFAGGWLTQYFPDAKAGVAGLDADEPTGEGVATVGGRPFDLSKLSPSTVGTLEWNGLSVGVEGAGPATSDRVWTAPRAVDAATVSTGKEAEKFLFYRGVANLDAPLRITRRPGETPGAGDDELGFHVRALDPAKFSGGWLVDVRPDGATAFRTLAAAKATGDVGAGKPAATTPATFAADAYDKANLATLRGEMRAALVDDGLFADEADALLNTWEVSYFKSPGLRFFFLVPRSWTDRHLPLTLSVKADVVRTMVGRIEIVTPRQRELVRQIAATSTLPPLQDVIGAMRKLQADPAKAEAYAALASGRGDVAALGVPVPEIYKHYLELGRFRTALILDQQKEFDGAQARLLQEFWRVHVMTPPARLDR
jgi:hypothetical protein